MANLDKDRCRECPYCIPIRDSNDEYVCSYEYQSKWDVVRVDPESKKRVVRCERS